jgi:hypothetical protein
MKLPTTFQELDLTGFEIETKQYNSITRNMLDIACAVLQKNKVGIATRSVQNALKYIYGIGGSADTVCHLLREWRADNLAVLKQSKTEKNPITVFLETTDDGVLDESDVPDDFLCAMRQLAIAVYKLAYQNADTTVSGDRIKHLITENDVLKQQLTDFPQLQLELNFYKSECERQRNELKEAYINLNQQKLIESEEFKNKLESLYQERNDLVIKNNELAKQFTTLQAQFQEAQVTINHLRSQPNTNNHQVAVITR